MTTPEITSGPDFELRPALWLAVSFAAGIIFASIMPVDLRVALAAAIVCAIAAIAFRERQIAGYLVLAAFLISGAVATEMERSGVPDHRIRSLYDNGTIRSGEPVEVEGMLLGVPEPAVDGLFLILRADKLKFHGGEQEVTGRVRLYLPRAVDAQNDDLALSYGTRIRVACKLEREDEYLNPGVIRRREILDRQSIDATATVKSSLLIEKVADESVFIPLAWVYDQRARLIYDIKANVEPAAAGVMIASLLGDKYFLDKNTADLFREGGTFHILIISGLHITFIGGLLLWITSRCTRNRWVRFVLPTTILWAYTAAVGADLPVVRAAVMFMIISFSYVIYRQRSLLNSLGLCALMLLWWRPAQLFDPSFQLTFVSVAAILAMAYPVIESLRSIGAWMPTADAPFPPNVPAWLRRSCEMLYWNDDAWSFELKRQIWTTRLFKEPFLARRVKGAVRTGVRYLFEATVVSLIVQIWMLPLTVIYFHRVSIASVVLNLWVGFFIAIESFAAVTAVLVGRLSSLLAMPFFDLVDVLNWMMLSVPRLFAEGGFFSFRLPAYSGDGRVFYFFYLIPILMLAVLADRWRPFDLVSHSRLIGARVLYAALAAMVLIGGIIIFHPFSAPPADGRLHLDFLDVGQGDSALITFPDGRTMLVDGGGRVSYAKPGDEDAEPFTPDIRSIGESVVSEFLWNRGYSSIDSIMASHADVDHIQGLEDVAANFTVGTALFGRTPMADPDYARLDGILARRGIPVEIVSRGDKLMFGDVTVEVLYPEATGDPEALSDNDHSVVLRITYGERSFLLTGDIERRAEADVVRSAALLKADIVKIGHHGSRTSSTQPFVDAVDTAYAVISVGRSSPFGHPHAEVVHRWQESDALVMTTGEKGTISVSTNGHDLAIGTFLK